MNISRAWDWKQETDPFWLKPSEESYYFANRWTEMNFKNLLDFGCGLGRHSIFFAKQGFHVWAFDLSEDGVNTLTGWAKKENLSINTHICDMLKLPYPDQYFDGIFAYHVISHTDTKGMEAILSEIHRVLKPNGEIFLSLCSKETWSYKEAGYPKIDDNTIVKTEEGPEQGVPHFYVTFDDIIQLFGEFEIRHIRHVDDCYYAGEKHNSKHYFILAKSR